MNETTGYSNDDGRLSRREVMRWFAAASAAVAAGIPGGPAFAAAPSGKGYGTDPDLLTLHERGAFWPLTLTPEQKSTVTALVDGLFPADDLSPAASTLRVPDFIDEWISAPYPAQQEDRPVVLAGLEWVEALAQKRYAAAFSLLTAEHADVIWDAMAPANGEAADPVAGAFFRRFRDLAAGAYYATPEGWKAIGYVGNVSMASFDGPPPEVLAQLGVEQTVK